MKKHIELAHESRVRKFCPIHKEVALNSEDYCHLCDDYPLRSDKPLPHEEAFPA